MHGNNPYLNQQDHFTQVSKIMMNGLSRICSRWSHHRLDLIKMNQIVLHINCMLQLVTLAVIPHPSQVCWQTTNSITQRHLQNRMDNNTLQCEQTYMPVCRQEHDHHHALHGQSSGHLPNLTSQESYQCHPYICKLDFYSNEVLPPATASGMWEGGLSTGESRTCACSILIRSIFSCNQIEINTVDTTPT